MRRSTAALAAVALASAALASVGVWHAFAQGVPDGQPDIHGTWTGKSHATEFLLSGTEPGQGSEPYAMSMVIAQTGADITMDVTITRDEGPLAFQLVGKVGRGQWWAQGTDPGSGNALVAMGTVNHGGNVMKGSELLLYADPIQVKFTAKRDSKD